MAALALCPNRVVTCEHLVDALWGSSPPFTARAQVQGCVSTLRKLLAHAGEPGAITTHAAGYMLHVADDALDSAVFSGLVAEARRQVSQQRPAEAAATLRRALDQWRGAALEGIYSDIVQRGATLLEEARLSAAEECIQLELDLGRHEAVTAELRGLATEYPTRERFHALLMVALYRAGRPAEALEAYRRVRGSLVAELGVEPGQELRDLERAVLNRDRALEPQTTADRDRAAAEAGSASPRQLPRSIADFIGREEQIEEIKRVLTDRRSDGPARYTVPVVAVSGGGGVGKSSLALRVAHEMAEQYPDGHLYLDLQGSDTEQRTDALLGRLLLALGITGSAMPEELEARAELYRSRIADKRMLLVLDDAISERQVEQLLPGSPSCAVLVTSRCRLSGIPGVHAVEIDAFDSDAATEMLANIVGQRRLRAEPEATAELVRYCSGLPLALRIGGARLASKPHWRIAELTRRLKCETRRLDELSHHGLEVRSSIALTYRSLPGPAQRLFRLLALVKGPDFPGWTAAALLDTELAEARELIELLIDAQVLDPVDGHAEGIRYRLHSLIRVYAQEQLIAVDPPAQRREAFERLLGAWLHVAETAHRQEYGGDYTIVHGSARRWRTPGLEDELSGNPMTWLDGERAALVAWVRQAAAAGLDEPCWDLALTAVSLFEVRGYFDDWRVTSEAALEATRRAGNTIGSAAMAYSLGALHMAQKRFPEASRFFAEALDGFRAGDMPHGQALVLRHAGIVDRLRGDEEAMFAKFSDALAMMRDAADLIGESNILRSVAKVRLDRGEVAEAGERLAAARDLCRRAGYRRGEAQVQSQIAELHLHTGQIRQARRDLNEVLRTVRDIGDRIGEAHALYGLGLVRRREGRLDNAEATLVHALAVASAVGDRLIEGQAEYALGEIALVRGNTAAARRYLQAAQTRFAELGLSLWHAKTLVVLAEAYDETGEYKLADESLTQARSLLAGKTSAESVRLLRQLDGERPALLDDAGDAR